METKLSEEQAKDIATRIEAFKKDYEEMVKKHEIECVAYPSYLPHPNGTFQLMTQIHMVDMKYRAKPSPMQAKPVIDGGSN